MTATTNHTPQDCARGGTDDHHHPMVAPLKLVLQDSPAPHRPACLLPERDGHLTWVDGVDHSDLHTLRLAAFETLRRSLQRGEFH